MTLMAQIEPEWSGFDLRHQRHQRPLLFSRKYLSSRYR
jgi:hypothetical protein